MIIHATLSVRIDLDEDFIDNLVEEGKSRKEAIHELASGAIVDDEYDVRNWSIYQSNFRITQ